MYSKYEKMLGLPRPLLAAVGLGLTLGFWRGFGLSLATLIALLVLLALTVLAPPLIKRLGLERLSPNQVTLAGLIVSLAAVYPLASGRFELGFVLVLTSSLLDMLDGYLARQTNRVSRRGGFLDSVLDRVADAAVLGGLCFHFLDQGRPIWFGLTLAALVGAFMVSYTRARAEVFLDRCEIGFGGERPDRLIALVATGIIARPEIGVVYVVVFAWLTTLRRIIYAWTRLADQPPKTGK